MFTHFCGKDQEVLPRAMSVIKQSPWPKDDSREKRWDLEWLCAGCSHESSQRGGLQPREGGQLSVLMWAQAAASEAVKTDLPEQRGVRCPRAVPLAQTSLRRSLGGPLHLSVWRSDLEAIKSAQ